MTGKERMLAALAGQPADMTPVGIDYMQLYLAERIERGYVEAYLERLQRAGRLRLDPDEEVEIRAQSIIAAYDCFTEPDDWMYVRGGPTVATLRDTELLMENGKIYKVRLSSGERRRLLLSGQESKTEEMRERLEKTVLDYRLAGDRRALLDEYRDSRRWDYRLARRLAEHFGKDYLLYCSVPAPYISLFDVIDFETSMMAMIEAPELVTEMLEYLLDVSLEKAQALRDAGAECMRVEECFASADLISPQTYEQFALPFEERYFAGLRRMGFKTILYFCGDVMPRLPALRGLPLDALMVEESKKDFIIDIAAVRQQVGPEMGLLGNIDVYGMVLKASEAELEAEVARQIATAGASNRFIVGVGSPITLDTPPARVDLVRRYARRQTPATQKDVTGGAP